MINEKLNKDILDLINENKSEINSIKGKILWTNPNPTNGFGAQNITLNNNDYDILEVYYYDATSRQFMLSQKAIKGYNFMLISNGRGSTSNQNYDRRCTYINDTQWHFENAYSDLGVSNDILIPIYIIGYKTGLFS